MFFVDPRTDEPRALATEAESSKPASISIGIDKDVTSRGGIEGAFAYLWTPEREHEHEPPSEYALRLTFETIVGLGSFPLKDR